MKLADLKKHQVKPTPRTWCIIAWMSGGTDGGGVCVGTGFSSQAAAERAMITRFPGTNTTAQFYTDHGWFGGPIKTWEWKVSMRKTRITVYKGLGGGLYEMLESVLVDEAHAQAKYKQLYRKHSGPATERNAPVLILQEIVEIPEADSERHPIQYARLPVELHNEDNSKAYPFEVIISDGMVRIQSADLKNEIYIEALIRDGNLVTDFGSWDNSGIGEQTAYVVLDFEAMLKKLLPF